MILGFVLRAVIWSSKLVIFKYHFCLLHAHTHMHICSSTVKWSTETKGTSQHLSECAARDQKKRKTVRKAGTVSATQGELKKAPGVKDPLVDASGEEWTQQHWHHKAIFQEAKSISKVWQRIWTTAANHKATEEIQDFRWWLIHSNSFTTPPCSACPMVSTHPSCPVVRCWPRLERGEGTKQSYCASKSLSICWGKPGGQNSCFPSCSGHFRKIFPFPSYSWKVSSSQDWK